VLYFGRVIPVSPDGTAVTMIGLASVGAIVAWPATGHISRSPATCMLSLTLRCFSAGDRIPDGQLGYLTARSTSFSGQAIAARSGSSGLYARRRIGGAIAAVARRTAAGPGSRELSLRKGTSAISGGSGFPGESAPDVGIQSLDDRDITEPHEIKAASREKNLLSIAQRCADRLLSVDDGSASFVNHTLVQWPALPTEIIAGGKRHVFLASRHLPAFAFRALFRRGSWDTTRRDHAQSYQGASCQPGSRRTPSDWVPSYIRDRSYDLTAGHDGKLSDHLNAFGVASPTPHRHALLDSFGVSRKQTVQSVASAPPHSVLRDKADRLTDRGDRERWRQLAAAAGSHADRSVESVPAAKRQTMVLYLSRLADYTEGLSDRAPDLGSVLTLHFIDITEQKNLEIQFAQSQKMQAIGQLAGGVAHDFNNLLTAMIGFCDLLLLRSPPGDPSFADIMQIKQNANRAANLVRQLLAFSRQQTLQPRVLNITDVLYELRHLIERLIGENIKLDVVHGRDLGLAKVDQGQLEQVIINLAVNARDAMPGGGALAIRTANVRQDQILRRGHEAMPVGDYVLIEVTDTGIGISKDNLARIFDPFFSTKELGSGTGLGLSTVYGIVKQTGGFVFVNSDPGRGAAFQIYLPLYEPADGGLPAQTDVTGFGR
jgi:two-component system cell cycle sensor histidine kinase/response regulator CckA